MFIKVYKNYIATNAYISDIFISKYLFYNQVPNILNLKYIYFIKNDCYLYYSEGAKTNDIGDINKLYEDIACALKCMHKLGVSHNNVSLSNIYHADGQYKLGHFAKAIYSMDNANKKRMDQDIKDLDNIISNHIHKKRINFMNFITVSLTSSDQHMITSPRLLLQNVINLIELDKSDAKSVSKFISKSIRKKRQNIVEKDIISVINKVLRLI